MPRRLLVTLLLGLVGCAPARPWPVTLALTSGVMGGLEPCACPAGPEGGVAREATVLARLRREAPPVIVLDGGDALTGTSGSDADLGATMIQALNRLGYGALVAGERETALAEAAWSSRSAEAGFPLLGRAASSCTKVVRAGDRSVGVIGLTRLANESSEQALARWIVLARRLKAETNLTVGLLHVPGQDPRQVARAMPDLAVLYDGHPRGLGPPRMVGETLVVEGYPFGGKAMTRLDLTVDPARGRVLTQHLRRIVLDARIPDDPALRRWLGSPRALAARPWPNLPISTLEGQPVFPSSWRGVPGLVVVTCWCAPCQEVATQLNRLHARHPRWGLRLMSLLDGAATAERVRALRLDLPVFIDSQYRGWEQLGKPTCPHGYVLDDAGRIREELGVKDFSEAGIEARLARLEAR